jgi:predicted metal-binding protein
MKPNDATFPPRKIEPGVDPSRLKIDLERYRSLAIELGAADAAVVSSGEIPVDERVRAKCMYPKCTFYGNNFNCPPHAPDLDFTRRLVARYAHGILFGVKGETADFTGSDFLKREARKNPAKVILNTVCAEVESRAFYEGYPFALAFGQGPCKSFWCPDQPCAALEPGGVCRFPLKSRSSVEGLGIDAYSMAARRGWEVYPCGKRVDASALPHVLLIGLVLVA